MTKYQPEHFRDAVYSEDPDVIHTFKVLLAHMPKNSDQGHLFLSPIQHPKTIVWFKKNTNLGESTLRHFVRDMAAAAGLTGDYTNKSGRVTAITRMCIAEVPLEDIASNSGHMALSSIQRYDRSKILRNRATQNLARPNSNSEPRNFQRHYEIEVSDWHEANTASRSQSLLITEHGDCGQKLDIEFRTLPSGTQPPIINSDPPSSIPIRASNSSSRPCFRPNIDDAEPAPVLVSQPIATAPVSQPFATVTQATPASLVEEEMQFWAQYFIENPCDDLNDIMFTSPRVAEALKGTRFAMQKNVALLCRENAVLKQQLCEASQRQSSFQQQLDALRRQQEQSTAFFNHQATSHNSQFFNHWQARPNGGRYSYPNPNFPGGGNQLPTRPNIQAMFPNVQGPVMNEHHEFPLSRPQMSSSNSTGNLVLPGIMNTTSMPHIAPVFGNTVYNYQNFDIRRFLSNQ